MKRNNRQRSRTSIVGLAAVPLALAAAALWPWPVGAVATLDPGNPTANFYQDGLQTFTVSGGVLTLLDQNKGDFIGFYAADDDAAPGIDLDVVATFHVRSASPNNADAGNQIAINDGFTKSAIAVSVVLQLPDANGNIVNTPGIGLYSQGDRSQPASYPVFVPVDWQAAPVRIRLRRWANGDAEIMEVNGVAPSPRALLTADRAPANTRSGWTVEFGSFSDPAECTVEYTEFRSERVDTATPFATMGAAAWLRLGPRAADDALNLGIRFALGAGSDGIAPQTEAVTVGFGAREFTIPAGAFKPGPFGSFLFQGVVDGMSMDAAIYRERDGTYTCGVSATRADLTGTVNPVPVRLAIGNDGGGTSITARFSR